MRGSGGVVALTCALAACAVAWPASASFPGANGHIVFSSNRRADLQLQVFAVPAAGGVAGNISRRPAYLNADANAAADGKIVFASSPATGNGGPKVWLIQPGGRRRPLVSGWAPSLSPDGAAVAYTGPHSEGLYVVSVRGGRANRVADTGLPGIWSPDSKSLAVADLDGVLLVRRDGTATRRLPLGLDANPGLPSWSPDGRSLVISDGALDVVDVETGRATRLVAGTEPAWSPAGDVIAFVRDGRIATIGPAGSATRDVTTPPEGESDVGPAWAPDGAHIAFVRRRPASDVAQASALHVLDVAAGREGALTPSDDHVVDPWVRGLSWSADGRTIYYASRSLREVFHLFTIGANLRGVRQVTRGAGSDRQPVWAPDGRRIAFVRNGDSLVVLDRGRTRVVARAAGLSSPTWSSDGRRLAYAADGAVWIVRGRAGTRIVTGSQPAWSPTGRWIAYVHGGLRLVHPDGTGDHWLKADEADLVFNSPTWSPRGTVVYYVSAIPCRGDEYWACSAFEGNVQGVRPFAHPVNDVRLPAFTGGKPGVSPDGRFFVFAGLTRVPISGAGLFFGTSSYATDVEPDWQRIRASRAQRSGRAASR